jgi:hypothetical protein
VEQALVMSDDAPDDAEARLIAVIERILRVVPHVLESEDARENAEVAANYALATLWELRSTRQRARRSDAGTSG